jgi:hypothetical protein
VEVGQTKFFIELFNNQKEFIQEIKPSISEKIVSKILKSVILKVGSQIGKGTNYA